MPGPLVALNPKCVAFAFMCMALLLACPNFGSPLVAAVSLYTVFVLAYAGMGWYDYRYGCSVAPLRRGEWSLTGLLKPPEHQPSKQRVGASESYGARDVYETRAMIYGLHLFLIAPFLFYVAWMGKRAPRETYWLMGALAAMTAGYHGVALVDVPSAD
jgi:hypothetical protein